MDGPLFNSPFVGEHENTSDLGSGSSFGGKMSARSSPKRRRAVQKRVVSVRIGDVDASRVKGEGAPPSDSWAWRKYGQKPIKGSPYPRGYYRCSSSKGCPARKQVERSRVDPTMLVITYACDHNHPWPASRNTASNTNAAITNTPTPNLPSEESAIFSSAPEIEPDDQFADLENDAALLPDDHSWFSDVASSPTKEAVLESPNFKGSSLGDADVEAMLLPTRDEDDSLFADLGELPECSVFRRGFYEREEESRQCSLRAAPWCGSTG
ncbi:probable WRKY transcription factor 65 [Magnolia sinica]|uniref:probable WRKY transcription factor 65 n=1 Tax=Magnolia sinica TaxID=86752 RepID=UPI00265980E6|nr:probable WRKY transcription factor 65 [Magnolia sinica]